jgi:predicted Ser/Thr protein kinase
MDLSLARLKAPMRLVSEHAIPAELAGRWRDAVVLKRDVFSTIERGRFGTADGDVDAIVRRLDRVPRWSYLLARHLFGRELRALAIAGEAGIGPRLLFAGDGVLVRQFISGAALHIARPVGNRTYFEEARKILHELHRLGVTHNDLAKEQNWLVGADGRPYLTDFQLASVYRKRSKLFRIAAYEELRHFLKHKRTYAPEALTNAERRILARKSLFTKVWMATGKRVYRGITRGIFRYADREGGGRRLVYDVPAIVEALKTAPAVRDVAVVPFPDRYAGTGLYAFVEAPSDVSERALIDALASRRITAPERMQIVPTLPRNDAGKVRSEILQLIAMNQIDVIGPLLSGPAERDVVNAIVAERRNLRDRFSF